MRKATFRCVDHVALGMLLLTTALLTIHACGSSGTDADGDGWTVQDGDCMDMDPEINPDATEICDDVDNDCDGLIDEGVPTTRWYLDEDEDGYGSEDSTIDTCSQPKHYAATGDDCDDTNPDVFPGNLEVCDGLDNDCNGIRDDGLDAYTWYSDADGDGFGAEGTTDFGCLQPDGFVMARGDCDDGDADIYPGATDGAGDGIDSDCGGSDSADPHVGLASSSYDSIQSAVGAARDGATVWVGPGTYVATEISFGGRGIALRSTEGPHVTTLDAKGQGRVFIFNSGETSTARVDGFTLTGGEADRGGAIRTNRTAPVLENLIITGNHASIDGGGVCSAFGAPVLRHVVIENNSADNVGGGGLANSSAEVTLEDVLFRDNEALEGGGYYAYNVAFTVNRVGFEGNVATSDGGHGGGLYLGKLTSFSGHNWWFRGNHASRGGGAYLTGISPTIMNLYFMENEATQGGGLFLENAGPTLQNLTIMANDADSGAGVYLTGNGSPRFINAVIAYNDVGNVFDTSNGTVAFSCSSLYAPDGSFNHNLSTTSGFDVAEEPTFLDYDDAGVPVDAHLAVWSPLVDAGCPDFTDPDGSPSDIGAYGGQMADEWDRDLDGTPDYFWPGLIGDAPQGFDTADFDCDDTVETVQVCQN